MLQKARVRGRDEYNSWEVTDVYKMNSQQLCLCSARAVQWAFMFCTLYHRPIGYHCIMGQESRPIIKCNKDRHPVKPYIGYVVLMVCLFSLLVLSTLVSSNILFFKHYGFFLLSMSCHEMEVLISSFFPHSFLSSKTTNILLNLRQFLKHDNK